MDRTRVKETTLGDSFAVSIADLLVFAWRWRVDPPVAIGACFVNATARW